LQYHPHLSQLFIARREPVQREARTAAHAALQQRQVLGRPELGIAIAGGQLHAQEVVPTASAALKLLLALRGARGAEPSRKCPHFLLPM